MLRLLFLFLLAVTAANAAEEPRIVVRDYVVFMSITQTIRAPALAPP